MNKETIDYTSEEFWKTAPKDATHWEPGDEQWNAGWIKVTDNSSLFWSNHQKDWHVDFREVKNYWQSLAKTFIPRPSILTKHSQQSSVSDNDWYGTSVPVAGEMVEAFQPLYEEWYVVKVLDSQENGTIAVRDSKDKLWWTYKFRPIKKEPTIQEKILDKWKAQALEFAYDTKDSEYPIGSMIDFIVNNYDVKEK